MQYDYLIVGAGIFGSVFAREMTDAGRKCLVVERRNHVGGNVYTQEIEGIKAHIYGPHLFHTNNKAIWEYVQRFAEFNNYQHKVKAKYNGKLYSLPFNMNTFYALWGCTTPAEAKAEIARQIVPIENPSNLEEWALSQVGRDIYDKLIYGYTKKQWSREPRDLPAFIIKRLPLRFTYNDNYHQDRYMGVPVKGFTHMVEGMLDGIDVRLEEEFDLKNNWRKVARKLVFSGCIDQFFDYKYGVLEYRTFDFKMETLEGDFQGIAQMNYPDDSVPYTRIVEHKHFYWQKCDKTVITYEHPAEWEQGKHPHLPINDDKNNALYHKYRAEANQLDDVLIGGRLGSFRYFDMHQVIAQAQKITAKERGLQ